MTNDYKVGDLVVFDTTKPFCRQMPNHLMEYIRVSPNCEHDVLVWIGNQIFEVGGKAIRPAKPEEIKANRRLNPSNSGRLEVLDMVDVPPTTMVVDQ